MKKVGENYFAVSITPTRIFGRILKSVKSKFTFVPIAKGFRRNFRSVLEELSEEKRKMPILSKPQEIYLSNGFTIGKRFLKHISEVVKDFGLGSPRALIIGLYDTSNEDFKSLLEFADRKLRGSVANLNEIQGNLMLEAAEEYLWIKFNTKKNSLAPALVASGAYLGNANSPTGQFMRRHYPQQRVYLQAICDAFEMIAAIKLMNRKIVADPKNTYTTVLDVWDQVIHPGRLVCRAAYILRNLMSLHNLNNDLDHADEVLGMIDDNDYLVFLGDE